MVAISRSIASHDVVNPMLAFPRAHQPLLLPWVGVPVWAEPSSHACVEALPAGCSKVSPYLPTRSRESRDSAQVRPPWRIRHLNSLGNLISRPLKLNLSLELGQYVPSLNTLVYFSETPKVSHDLLVFLHTAVACLPRLATGAAYSHRTAVPCLVFQGNRR